MRVGDKVICINDMVDFDKQVEINQTFLIWVKKDVEYTIREFLDNDGIVTGLLLEEIHNFPVFIKLINRIQEPAFATWRFRKIASVSQTISIEENELIKI